MTRAAAYAFTATLAATGTAAIGACGGSSHASYGAPGLPVEDPGDAGMGEFGAADAQGDAAKDSAGDAPSDAGDAGQDAAGDAAADVDAGGNALYGAPAVPGRDLDPPSSR